MSSIVDIIEQRISVRTYTNKPVEEEKVDQIIEFLNSNVKGPFGNKVKFQLMNLTDADSEEVKALGTYGVIRNAYLYIVGIAKKADKAMEDFGYCMEKNILKATELGLGTCWLGGTFSRSNLAQKIGLSTKELMPAIAPVGYPGDKKSFADKTLRLLAKSKHRKPWEEIFFDGDMNSSLSKNSAGQYQVPLECVRIAPSASNQQPWRIIRGESGKDFHFYLKRTKGYNKLFQGISLQNIDMGIAMCHFELAAKEVGLKENWNTKKDALTIEGLVYIVSWQE